MPIAPAHRRVLPGAAARRHPEPRPRRLSLVSVNDSSARPLSQKLLERPRLLRRIGELIPDRSRSHLVPYNTTPLERDLALALGIPMYGADPRLFDLGTKTGCRRLFAEEGVRHPLGVEDLHTARRPGGRARCGSARHARPWPRSSSSSTRASPARATRSSTWPHLPGAGDAGRAATRSRLRLRRMQLRGPGHAATTPTSPSWPSEAASSRSGSPASSCAARACSCG